MRFALRHAICFLAAFAVFVVSTTCTSAGCLLPFLPMMTIKAESGTPKRMACCSRHSRSNPQASREHKPGHCPTCDEPLYSASLNVHQIGGIVALDHAVMFFALAHVAPPSIVMPISVRPIANPAVGPPTLVQLHCALLI